MLVTSGLEPAVLIEDRFMLPRLRLLICPVAIQYAVVSACLLWTNNVSAQALQSDFDKTDAASTAVKYFEAPLRYSAETNKLIAADIGSGRWLDDTLDQHDRRARAVPVLIAMQQITEKYNALKAMHDQEYSDRLTRIGALNLAASASPEPISSML